MKIVTHLLALIAGLAASYVFINQRVATIPQDRALLELLHTKGIVEKRLDDCRDRLARQLTAFSTVVANDRDFAMKLIVEQDVSAPEVSEIAARYMDVMDLDLLEVADGAHVLLSCGHFPASAGNSVEAKAAQLDSVATLIYDNVKGQRMLTMQARIEFSIGEEARLACMGGMIVDSTFIHELAPREGLRVLFRYGDLTMGMYSIEAMSEITDNTMIVNDTTYLATSVRLRHADEGEAPELILLSDIPPKVSLF